MTMHDTAALREALPYARRYARALAGSQSAGDALVAESLRRGLPALPARLALYANITLLSEPPEARPGEPLSPRERCALLLTSLEGLTVPEAAQVLAIDEGETETTIADAREKVKQTVSTDVLIIEDEPVIAADIEALVSELGHRVTDIAATHSEAVASVARHAPSLVLADIQLADGSSGIDAVKDILEQHDLPVIFITAFPERLLTGERPEPTFLITKPFQPETVKAAISQALFFHPRKLARHAA